MDKEKIFEEWFKKQHIKSLDYNTCALHFLAIGRRQGLTEVKEMLGEIASDHCACEYDKKCRVCITAEQAIIEINSRLEEKWIF